MDKEEVKKVIHSVTSDAVKTEVRRNSTGKANTKTSSSLLSSNEKVIPRYLDTCINSCHDYCKYGKKHVFEAKKRTPNLRSLSASSCILDEEQKEVSALQGRRKKKQETKMKTATPSKGEGSLKEPIIVKMMTPSLTHQTEELSETSETSRPETSSPTEKRVVSHDAITPIIWSEKSSDGSENMELDSPSSIHTPKDQLDGSSNEPIEEKLTPLPITEIVGSEKTASVSTQKNFKAKILPTAKKSTAFSSREAKSEKTTSIKLKAPKPNQIKDLKIVEEMKGGMSRMKSSPPLKTEILMRPKSTREKNIVLTEQPTVEIKIIPLTREKIAAASVKSKVGEHKSPFSAKEAIMSVSPRFTKQKGASASKKIDGPGQPSVSLQSRTPVVKSTPTLNSSRGVSAQRNSKNKIVKSLSKASTSIKPSVIKDKSRSMKPLSPAKEKTLYVVEPKPLESNPKSKQKEVKKNWAHSLSSTTSSPSSSSSSSLSSLSVLLHEKEESEKFESTPSKATKLALAKEKTSRSQPVNSPKYNEKRSLGRIATATVLSEAKASSTSMMKFRRGKVISPKVENNTPRILKFRQQKGTNENNKEMGRRNIQRRRVSSGSSSELIAPSLKAPAVVLRHQDVQEKETQASFNDVIEETANKLVETRKSKVKALVGAFETVISLQESRVAPTVG